MKKIIDWTKIYKKYRGRWVALGKDEETVLSTAKTAPEAYNKALKQGVKEPILMRVPKKVISYVGYGLT